LSKLFCTSYGAVSRFATGGHPGAFLHATHTFTTGDTILTGGIKANYTYNPMVMGAIASLSVSADVIQFQPGGTAWYLVIEQNGKRYYSFPFGAFYNTAWAKVAAANLTAANFDTNSWAGNAGIPPDGNRPDFSLTAAPLRFGFMFGNNRPEIAVLFRNDTTGISYVDIRDTLTSALIKRISFGPTVAKSVTLLQDTDGNGVPELAVVMLNTATQASAMPCPVP
jgi:hypothetical protein